MRYEAKVIALKVSVWCKKHVYAARLLDPGQVRFIRRISAVSNEIQTKDNEASHLIIYCLNFIRHGSNAAYEPGLNETSISIVSILKLLLGTFYNLRA